MGAGYDQSTRQATFTIGIDGMDPENYYKVESVIHRTLDTCCEKGLDKGLVEAGINNFEVLNK